MEVEWGGPFVVQERDNLIGYNRLWFCKVFSDLSLSIFVILNA